MNRSFKTLALCAAVTAMLAACGGGDDPDPTNRDSLITLSAATNATLNGIYGASNTSLSDVQTIVRAGATDACEFTYDNIKKTTDSTVTLTGRIRYIKDANTLNEYSIAVGGTAFARADGVNTIVDRAANVIRYNGSVATGDAGATVTVTGTIPIPFSRPSGC